MAHIYADPTANVSNDTENSNDAGSTYRIRRQ